MPAMRRNFDEPRILINAYHSKILPGYGPVGNLGIIRMENFDQACHALPPGSPSDEPGQYQKPCTDRG